MKVRLLFALFFASLAFDAWRIGGDFSVWMIPAALVGWFLADLMSGLVHMYMDYRPLRPGRGLAELYFWQGSRETPEFEAKQAEVYARISRFERIVYDFKKHHPMPDLLGRHGLFHLMKAPTLLAALPMALEFNLLLWVWPATGWLIIAAMAFLIGVSLSQYFHGTLHRERACWSVRTMRRAGLLMSLEAHQTHHQTLVRDFSVISGWSNPAVNALATFLLKHGWLDPAGLEPT